MWEMISQWLSSKMGVGGGAATVQTGDMAKNIAGGAMNSGWGSMGKDMAAGNYASAAGNAIQMGQDSAKRQNSAMMSQIPNFGQSQTEQPMMQQTIPTYGGIGQSSLLQQLSQRYLR